LRTAVAIMKQTQPTILELGMNNLEELLERAEAALGKEDYATIKSLIESYAYIADLVSNKNITISRLQKLLFGAKTEKTAAVVGREPNDARGTEPASSATNAPPDSSRPSADQGAVAENDAKTPSGHGRNGADAYTGAERVEVPHESLRPGDPCPQCADGTVYESRPGVLVRLVGQAPVQAMVYYLQKLRCNLCGVVFTAQSPDSVGVNKYDATAGSMIALLKYGAGMPFHRAEKLQESLGIPLPASTQWDIVHEQAERAQPVFDELVRQAADGDVVHNDDTTVKILELMGKRADRARHEALAEASAETGKTSERKGMFTSGIVSSAEGRKIALFLSGRQHAGENLKDVLKHRAQSLGPPIQMCDALSRNLPGELKTIVANCLAHGRRQFVDVAERFPEECRCVLESLAVIYKNDAISRERNLSPAARRHFHQAESGPTMEALHVWLVRQFDDRRVEPNSTLGGAISYMLKHWEKLTLFLRVPGAPLDNNICERTLKKAILHRKNALFYKTCHGAHVGDVFMSLICTCEFCGTNPFDYLTEIERHADHVGMTPQNWLPWNYRETLERMKHGQASSEEGCQDK
jgi:transposase